MQMPPAHESYAVYVLTADMVAGIWQSLGLSLGKKKNLGAMANGLLGVVLDKSQQCSDWAMKELSRDQLVYAALDAWASAGIVEVLYRHSERLARARDKDAWKVGASEHRLRFY